MLNIEPLFAADPTIQMHTLAALGALLLGALQFLTPAGALFHRRLGYSWVSLMFIVTISSFFISANPVIGQYGWIHGLSILTTVALIIGVIAARRGQRRAHRSIMINVFWFALVLTGIFTLLPGRLMHQVVFG